MSEDKEMLAFEIRTNGTRDPRSKYRLVCLRATGKQEARELFDQEYRRSDTEVIQFCRQINP